MTPKPEDNNSSVHILLVEDNQDYAYVLMTRFSTVKNPVFNIEHVENLQAGIESLAQKSFDAVLLDLTLPDSHGLDTFLRIHAHAPAVPIVVLTGIEDETMGLEAVRRGAQDFLAKRKADYEAVAKVLLYAIERHRTQGALAALSLTDELTGLNNRRGFLALAEQQLKLAHRTKRGLALVYIDLDGFKQINDCFGHQRGDQALIDVAQILRHTFRGSDVIARVGGDEFAVLAIEASSDSGEILKTRLYEKLKDHNEHAAGGFKLSFSYGVVNFDPDHPCSLEELMHSADRAMYVQKRSGTNGP
jgi:diguanylate cyclase (GGDEF)-like protein